MKNVPSSGQAQCYLCPAGSYSSINVSASCNICPSGTSGDTGPVGGSSSCVACETGYFVAANGTGRLKLRLTKFKILKLIN